jgi:hypothetical protein
MTNNNNAPFERIYKMNQLIKKRMTTQLSITHFWIKAFAVSCILFLGILQTANSQTIAGPCGSSITITNASSPTAMDGKFVVSGLTGSGIYMKIGITGSEMYSEAFNITNGTCVLTGLGAGTYTFKIYKEVGGVYNCGQTTQVVTIGATSVAACAGTEAGGTIFHDANANGINEIGEQGAAGITINAYNNAGTLVSTQTSSSAGVYKFTGLTAGQTYRLEYTWADGYLKSGAAGTGSGTSVQFINSGSCAANFGVNFPPNYCQTNNPYVMTPCYINGNPTAPAIAPLDVMVAFPYKASNFDFGVGNRNVAPTHVATASQIGATWAVAYQKTSKFAFTGATMRRFAGFGPLGTGGIYKINMTTPTAPVVANWIDAKTIGINTGLDTRNATAANSLSTAPGTPVWDAAAFNQVGKVGIGGMDFNERGDTLWLMNLSDRKLYGIKNVNAATTPVAGDVIGGYSVALPAGYSYVTVANDFRPWAVKYYKGLVYVGAICSGESTPWTTASLKGYVLSFNPANPAAGFSYVADYPLGMVRMNYNPYTGFNMPWVSNTTTQFYTTQPMALDIEFDVDGSMIVSTGDRGGFQHGNNNYPADPTATNTTLIEGGTLGDVFRFCKTGATTYAYEGTAGCPFPTANPYAFQEYYWGDTGPYTSSSGAFSETSAGGIATLAGSGTVLMTAQDAYAWYGGGTVALSNASGGDKWRYAVYDNTTPGASGKAAGLGDLETLCDPAPIEIGNRVWVDVDNDGVQDANEVGLANITVDLYKAGILVTSTTTAANGTYKFTGLLPNTAYEIRVVLGQANINARPIGSANTGSNDFIDSDMTGAGTGVIALTTGYYGDNNHSYDIAFQCNTTVSATITNACVGATANLTATSNYTVGTYAWSGPNGFTSNLQNPTIPNVQAINAGNYTVTFTEPNGCSASNTVSMTVNAYPIAVAGANSPNLGGTLQLTGSGGTSYAWSGPNGFTSTLQNPSLTNVTAPMAGNYYVTVTNNGCSAIAALSVAFNCGGPLLNFANPVLVGGTGAFGAVGSKYRFSNITTGVDGLLTIVAKTHPDITIITLDEPAATSGGYNEAMQPIIDYNWFNGDGTFDAAGEKRVDFKLDFVTAGGTTPVILAVVNATALDVDGSGAEVREFFETNGYTSYELQTGTTLTVTGSLKAKGSLATEPGVNETALTAMVSMGYSNISGINFSYGGDYNGVTAGFGDLDERRLNSFQFKCYDFNTEVICPQVSLTTSSSGTICTGAAVSLSAFVSGGGGTCSLSWQSSPDGVTWTTIAGVSTTAYTTPALTTTTYFRNIYTCSATYCAPDTSAAVLITVVADPSVSLAINTPTICVGGVATLTATVTNGNGTNSFQWQQDVAGTWTNVGTNTASYTTATLTTNANYRVIVTQSTLGCQTTSSTASVVVVADPTVSVVTTAPTICVGGSITLSATPNGGTGTCTVQWQSSPVALSTWSNIVGATSNTFNTTLNADLKYRAQLTCTGSGCCN